MAGPEVARPHHSNASVRIELGPTFRSSAAKTRRRACQCTWRSNAFGIVATDESPWELPPAFHRPDRLLQFPPMALINDNYLKLKAGYLFPEIARRVKAFQEANPAAKIIR